MDDLDFSKLTIKEVYSNEVITRIMSEEDALTREQMGFDLLDRADEFGEKTKKRVERMLKAGEQKRKDTIKQWEKSGVETSCNYTKFGDEFPPLLCGKWQADMRGVYNPDAIPKDRCACPHPIFPFAFFTNVEDGTRKVQLAFYRFGRWHHPIFPKGVVSNKAKITELSNYGISVTSETAKSLVEYLFDVENLNYGRIQESRSTAKMGWCEDGFMPYDSQLVFDRDGRFDTLYSTITSAGDRQKWMDFVLSIRASGRIEPRLVMAASLASVLLKPCGLLPFWVDLWGTSGGGKSICGMLAASIWADPEIGKYVSKFDSTIPAFEAKAGFLNHLPFVIDDTAEIRKRLKDDFSQLIYQLASGEGKERSNTKLGLAQKTTWDNIIICSGESPIITDQLQGGAVNRVLEYEVDEGKIFPDGQKAATLLRNNYGFIGREFINVLNHAGTDNVLDLQQTIFNQIKNDQYEDKQLLSLSAILTADSIAERFIFKDGIELSFTDLEKLLTNKNSMSENERCYEYIINECMINDSKFYSYGKKEQYGEIWGRYINDKDGGECVAIIPNKLNEICVGGGFSAKAFMAWAGKKGILIKDSRGCPSKQVRIGDKQPKCYVLKLPEEILEETDDDFIEI